jgi:hypothetical protein
MKYRSFLESQKFQNLDEEFSEFAETLSAEKSLDEEFNEFLEEGVHDKGIFKAVFLVEVLAVVRTGYYLKSLMGMD